MPPMKTSRVQIVCRECDTPFWTQVRGRSTKCPHCQAGRYVRTDQEWEGPVTADTEADHSRATLVASRLPVWCRCRCGHEWQSRAADGMRLRCPSCGNGIRVPHRDPYNTGTSSMVHLPTPAPARPPQRTGRQLPDPLDWEDQEEEEEEVPATTLADALQGLMRAFRLPTAPGVPTPAPRATQAASRSVSAPPRPTPRPAPATASTTTRPASPARELTPAEALRERRRRDSACNLYRSLGGPLFVWYDRPAGACEALDSSLTRDRQVCGGGAGCVVTVSTGHEQTAVYACGAHAPILAAIAEHAGLQATSYPLRRQ